jgi:hypothetical protein
MRFAADEEACGASLLPFVKDEFDAYLGCGILAHGPSMGSGQASSI